MTNDDANAVHVRERERATAVRVLPLVGDAGNRRVLVEWLADRYDVASEPEPPEALGEAAVDVCIVDAPGFDRYREELIAYKDARAPRIVPYLFVRPEDRPVHDADVQQYVDDVIRAPISKRELAWRIESLLRMREVSIELAERNEWLEHLASAAAHDLRNPLNVAQGYLEGLDGGEPARRITEALDRMNHLIENVLTVSRTQYDLTEEDLEPIALGSLVAECEAMTPTQSADIAIADGEGRVILAAPTLVRQLLENLFRNAVDHGGEDVTIRVGVLEGARGFYVADDGPGIPEGERDAVFEEGYSTAGGSGLGLAIVTRVVDAHGWEIRVADSELGGVRFEVTGVELA